MYTTLKKKLDYVFLNLSDKTEVDGDRIISFLDIVKNQDPKIVFSYDCLEYRDINKIISYLCCNFLNYMIRVNKFKHIEKIDDMNLFIDELHIAVDHTVNDREKNTESFKILSYFDDIDKSKINNFYFDVYVDIENLNVIKNCIKLLSEKNYQSCICFKEFRHSGRYDCDVYCDKLLKNDFDNLMVLDDILLDNRLLIKNRNYVKKMMIVNNFTMICDMGNNINYVCLDYDFKLRMCPCIKSEIDLDPLSCFDSNGFPNEQLCGILQKNYNNYCYGCSCLNFNFD